ncbi:hypothetical protein Noda2021_02450 [Candidatus Dependentiae bacterium Noda2021]|nr:hypothetical protein Noda2021_02450 [Candidatus Dependentiae bacterium Noda2021]
MTIKLKTLVNQLTLKIAALALGYIVWSVFCCQQVIEISVNVPVCFYNLNDNFQLECAEKLTLALKGRRNDLAAVEYDTLAVHIDGADLRQGPNHIYPSEKNLFLPSTIRISHIQPNNLVASLTKRSK